MAAITKTRFMVMSDTHNYDFGDSQDGKDPLPACDVLLHAGDLTYSGTVPELEAAIDMLASIQAELKLVIAGNHDMTLDGPYWKRAARFQQNATTTDDLNSDDEQSEDHERAIAVMRGDRPRNVGVTYLEEGLHTFTLKSGATFTIYASPWQPEFCNMAFNYDRDTDRFNPPEYIMTGIKEVAGVKIPDFPHVDIMMTHGPPRGIMDLVYEGRMSAPVGCDALMTAAGRARPKLYCFGHIHEGYGAELITWKDHKEDLGSDAIADREKQPISFPEPLNLDIKPGTNTLMVNAAIMTLGYKPTNAPWLVDLELPTNSDSSNAAARI
jgi:hypothetical protein